MFYCFVLQTPESAATNNEAPEKSQTMDDVLEILIRSGGIPFLAFLIIALLSWLAQCQITRETTITTLYMAAVSEVENQLKY